MNDTADDRWVALSHAVRAGDTAALDTLLRAHPALRGRLDEPIHGHHFGETPLMLAVIGGDRAMADALLGAGADIDARSHWWAGSFGVLDRDDAPVAWLLGRGATLDAYAAARHGLLDRLAAIVAADPGAARQPFGDGQTPLHVAGTREVAAFLLEHGADIDALDVDHESSPAQYLVRRRPEVARELVRRGARTDILLCAALGDLARVREHLDAHPESVATTVSAEWFPMRNPHAGGTIYIWTLGEDKTAHVVAHEGGHTDVVRLLMERSPVDVRLAATAQIGDARAFTELAAREPAALERLRARGGLLAAAAETGSAASVALLLDAGWPPEADGGRGATALHWAAWRGDTAMARAILRHHPPLDAHDRTYDGTPLGWAMYGSLHGPRGEGSDYAGVVQALLEAGAEHPTRVDDRAGSAAVREVLERLAD